MEIILLPGTSIVELESQSEALALSGLVLPHFTERRWCKVGYVVQSNMTDRDRAHLGVETMFGCRVIIDGKHGAHLDGNRYLIHNLVQINKHERGKRPKFTTPILAIVPDGAVVRPPSSDEVQRCMHCGPAKSTESRQSMILVGGKGRVMYCPRCKKTQDGEVYDAGV